MKPSQPYTIYALYENFFEFLTTKSRYDWNTFCKSYTSYAPGFFKTYFETFTYSKSTLSSRIESIAPEHYEHLKALVRRNPPEAIVARTLDRCVSFFSTEHIRTYLIIGFFSADGFTLIIDKKPVVGIGLERFHDFSSLNLLVAHEYAHCIRITNGYASRDRRMNIINEGISTHFSLSVFPERTLPEHLFLSNAAFNDLLRQKEEMVNSFLSASNTEGGKIEPAGSRRTRQFTGYFLIDEYLRKTEEQSLDQLLDLDPETVLENMRR